MAAVGYAERERMRQEQGEGSFSDLMGTSADGFCRTVSLTYKYKCTLTVCLQECCYDTLFMVFIDQ